MRISKKKRISISVIVVLAIIIGIGATFISSAEEINETNPELTLAKINSDVENQYYSVGAYMQDSELTQADGKYNLKTNAYVAWSYNDDIAFAYKTYNVSGAEGDYIEATVTIDSIPTGTSGDLHYNASAGLMFRSGLQSDDAEVFIHVRKNSILAVYRSKAGDDTYVQYTDNTVKFPVELKMYKEMKQVKLSYKSAGGNWRDFMYPIGMTADGPLYVGVAAHSHDAANSIVSNFSNFTVKGIGTYGGEPTDKPDEKEEYVEEDSTAASNVQLRETFTDGDLTNEPASATNPIWDKPNDLLITNLDGNRVWERTFVDQNDWVGDWNASDWVNDYDVSVDVMFTDKCNPDPASASNTFRLYARHTGIEFYGHSHYAATISKGYEITLYKATFVGADASVNGGTKLGNTVDLRTLLGDEDYTCLGDGKWHTLKMRVFDNQITVYWGDKGGELQEIISYTDEGVSEKSEGQRVFGVGNVGIGTYQTAVYVDNLLVERLTDTFGGDYDNWIGGNWNQPKPDYVK